MNLLKYLLIIAVMVGAYKHFSERFRGEDTSTSPNGFVPVQMPDDGKEDTVLILAPLNCPSDEAKRADALAARLDEMGIPNRRSSSYHVFNPRPERMGAVERATEIFRRGAPAVFINGMAKSNPSAEEVALEYERTK